MWPEWATDVSPAVICNRLGTAPDRIREWRRSAARSGIKKVLEFVTSWYTGIDLGQLAAERDSNEPANPVFQQQLHDRACIISSYAETDDFIPSVEGEFVEADEPADSEADYLSGDAPAGRDGEGTGSSSEDAGGRAEPDDDVMQE